MPSYCSSALCRGTVQPLLFPAGRSHLARLSPPETSITLCLPEEQEAEIEGTRRWIKRIKWQPQTWVFLLQGFPPRLHNNFLSAAHTCLCAKGQSPFRELGKPWPAPAAPLFAEPSFTWAQFLILKSSGEGVGRIPINFINSRSEAEKQNLQQKSHPFPPPPPFPGLRLEGFVGTSAIIRVLETFLQKYPFNQRGMLHFRQPQISKSSQ